MSSSLNKAFQAHIARVKFAWQRMSKGQGNYSERLYTSSAPALHVTEHFMHTRWAEGYVGRTAGYIPRRILQRSLPTNGGNLDEDEETSRSKFSSYRIWFAWFPNSIRCISCWGNIPHFKGPTLNVQIKVMMDHQLLLMAPFKIQLL